MNGQQSIVKPDILGVEAPEGVVKGYRIAGLIIHGTGSPPATLEPDIKSHASCR